MEWLRQIAPLVGTALGGPLGGAAASFVASKLDLEDNTVKAVTDLLSSNKLSPEQVTSIKQAEDSALCCRSFAR